MSLEHASGHGWAVCGLLLPKPKQMTSDMVNKVIIIVTEIYGLRLEIKTAGFCCIHFIGMQHNSAKLSSVHGIKIRVVYRAHFLFLSSNALVML